jgi:hypothetical protein
MILGMTPFTFFHVALSLVAILSGAVVVLGMAGGKRLDGWTGLFLLTAILTDVTGFMFPYHGFTPGIGVGIVSLIVLAIALYARYSRHLAGGARRTYAITAVLTLYFNAFVLVAQLFEHVPSLHALAPKGSEPPFAIAQGIVMGIFIALGIAAVKGFRDQGVRVLDRTGRAA